MNSGEPRQRRRLATSPFNRPEVVAEPAPVYAPEDRVTHDRYGLGTVVAVEGTGSVVVNFGAETRRITLPSTKLSPL
jgi:hypothetical protein